MPAGLIAVLAVGHLVVDLCQGALPLLLPILKETFQLSYTAVGAVVLIASFSSSIVQPLFGIFSDRFSFRWLLPLGCFLTCLGFGAASVASTFWMVLLAIFIGGLGCAAYHPEGARATFFITRRLRATMMSFYSFGGNVGFGLGPLAAAFLIATWGREGFAAGLLVPGVLMAVVLSMALPAIGRESASVQSAVRQRVGADGGPREVRWAPLTNLVAVISLRSFIHAGMTTFIPLYYMNYIGGSITQAGQLLSVFLLAGALGTLTGGPLADRWGCKNLILASFAAAFVPLLVFPHLTGIWMLVAVYIAGYTIISSFAPTAVMAQELAPGAVGLASGLAFGFAIGMGGIGAILLGLVADHWGLPLALTIIGLLPVPAFILTWLLPVTGEKSPARLTEQANTAS
ncbi:MAG: MFS transporter [Desulforudis sp.]|jgi:FSR family fosmidomycin resistance protein-like MFS transporter|nr:MFS transporter [Clostridia bacterium]MDQ7792085.1 MFS transporter [Clostridia bacterium]RJX20558.1 MAG: MFS transporter [Desulforudis sp.]